MQRSLSSLTDNCTASSHRTSGGRPLCQFQPGYGDRRFGPEPFIRHRRTLSPADYAHASRGENV